MNATAPKSRPDNITPAVHLEFIHHHSVDWERSRQRVKTHEERLSFLESRLKQTQLGLGERAKFVSVKLDGRDDIEPTSPWNNWDLTMFVVCALGIICLITFGILNISFNLLESGLITFRENPLRSYLWAALLPVGALAVKIGWDSVHNARLRDAYLWICLGLGMIGVLVWVGAYACVYPTLSKGISEHIASLTVFDHGSSAGGASTLNFAGAKWIDVITVAGQAI